LTAGVLILTRLARPRVAAGANRILDLALIGVLAAVALQLAPLPSGLRLIVAPSSIAYEQAVSLVPTDDAGSPGPITVVRDATVFALYIDAVVILLFWSARRAFEGGGVRRVVRAIAVFGLITVPMAIAQHVWSPRAFYGAVLPITSNALPFTPFVNRNDFAAWLLTAVPAVLGYAIARIQSRRHAGNPFDPEKVFDNTSMILGFAIFAMTVGLLASLSRSGLLGLLAGLALFLALAHGRVSAAWLRWMALAIAGTLLLGLMYTNSGALGDRLSAAVSEGFAGRFDIWRQTWPMVGDFWPAGSGVGTYQKVMLLYQTSSRRFSISHADNEYLQILAEGGALLAVPAAIAIIAAAIAIRRRLLEDRSPMFWVRGGAACGIFGLAIQNVFEMTLRVPANAVLLALLAAIALHDHPMPNAAPDGH
jgi:O-antigen ligase